MADAIAVGEGNYPEYDWTVPDNIPSVEFINDLWSEPSPTTIQVHFEFFTGGVSGATFYSNFRYFGSDDMDLFNDVSGYHVGSFYGNSFAQQAGLLNIWETIREADEKVRPVADAIKNCAKNSLDFIETEFKNFTSLGTSSSTGTDKRVDGILEDCKREFDDAIKGVFLDNSADRGGFDAAKKDKSDFKAAQKLGDKIGEISSVGVVEWGDVFISISGDESVVDHRIVGTRIAFSIGANLTGEDDHAYIVVDGSLSSTAVGAGYTDIFDLGAGNDSGSGLAGDDRLYGGGGNDNLLGGEGDDLLGGGFGKDTLRGEEGRDTFLFNAKAKKAGKDFISDFQDGVDQIMLTRGAFKKLSEGALSGDAFAEYFDVTSSGAVKYAASAHGKVTIFKAPGADIDATDFVVIA